MPEQARPRRIDSTAQNDSHLYPEIGGPRTPSLQMVNGSVPVQRPLPSFSIVKHHNRASDTRILSRASSSSHRPWPKSRSSDHGCRHRSRHQLLAIRSPKQTAKADRIINQAAPSTTETSIAGRVRHQYEMRQRREGRKGTQGTGRTGHGEQDGAGTQTDKASMNRKERNHTV